MKKTGILLGIIMLVGALLMPLTSAFAATDGYYQLSEISQAWDGTDANRTTAPTADYDYTYGDESSVTYTLPWSFSFYGQSYSSITADTNGNVWFGATGSANSFNLATTGRGPVIAAWNNDLSSYFFGGVYIQHKTNPERVVIEWQTETYRDESYGRQNNFAVVLFPNGTIRMDYRAFDTATGQDFGSGISKGDDSASLNLTTNYGNAFTLAGRSFLFGGGQKIYVANQSESFGNTLAGTTSQPHTINVYNGGTDNLLINSVTLASANGLFSLVNGSDTCSGATVLPGQKCTVQTVFAPATVGQQSGLLTISSNDPATPTLDITLTGTGINPTLTVAKSDNGSGTVISSPAGITCGTTCSAQYETATVVALSAAADSGSVFTGWSGACSGTGDCLVAMDAVKNVTASFAQTIAPTVTIASPSGTSIYNRPSLQYSVSSGTVVVKVDGVVVNKISGDLLDTLAEGTHVIRVEATNSAGFTGYGESTVIIDTQTPTLVTVAPATGTQNVTINQAIAFTFSEALNPASITKNCITLSSSFGTVPGVVSVSADGTTVTFKPLAQLAYKRDYTLNFNARIVDLIGNSSVINNTSTFKTVTAASDLVGLWRMDGDWSDASGNGRNGTASGGVTFTGDLREGTMAGNFNGVSDYVAIGNLYGNFPNNKFTIESWVKLSDTGGGIRRTIAGGVGQYADYTIGVESNQFMVETGNRNNTVFYARSGFTPNVGQWYHVAGTFDGSRLKLYVNGEVKNDIAASWVQANGGVDFWIGSESCCSGNNLNGLIDKVYVFNRALTAQEINDHFKEVPQITITSPGQTVPYKPGETGTATFSVTHPAGINNLTCRTAGAASGELSLVYDSPQTQVTQDFHFNIAANAAPSAAVTLSCTSTDLSNNVGSASLALPVADLVVPMVVSTSVADNATNVPATLPVTVTFSKALASATVNATSVTLIANNGSNQQVAGTVTLSADLKTISFTPTLALEGNTPYLLTISTALTDTVGNQLPQDYLLHFTTQSVVDISLSTQGTSSSPNVVSAGRYGTIILNNSYVIFDGPVTVDNLTLTNGSVISHYGATTTATYKLEVTANTINIDGTSKIDVTGKGYLGGSQGSNTSSLGMTLGNTTTGGSTNYSNGGSYGGLGGLYSTGSVNAIYGNMQQPGELGSGGSANGTPGGNGGGLVKLTASTVTLNGSILADGGSTTGSGGGGSGGGILLNIGSLSGSGTISASGGSFTSNTGYASGGGGRIAIYYDANSLPTANIVASGGKSGDGSLAVRNGGAGTIYLKDNAKAKGDVIINNGGIVTTNATSVPGGDYGLFDVKGGAVLSVTGNMTPGTDMTITGSNLSLSGGITAPGNLTLDGSSVTVAGAVNVANILTLKNGSTLSHYGATTTATYKLEVTANTINIDGTSKIYVTGKGYLGGSQGSNTSSLGMTLGNTTTGGSTNYSNGGSYGGLGGLYSTGSVNAIYGNMQQPGELGSGGSANGTPGGNGGGLVKLTASTVTLNGSILADGGSTTGSGGGGSGGGILLNIGSLSGSGTISASGGSFTSNTGYASGGGGRIAIYYDANSLPTANIVASGGKSGDGSLAVRNGGAGTIYLKDNAKAKGDVIINNGGIVTTNATSVPGGDYGLFDVKGGAVLSVTGNMTTGTDMVITGRSTLNLTGGLTAPGNLTLDGSNVTVGGAISVANTLTLKNNSSLSHLNATTTATYKLDVTAGTVSIESGSKIDVTGKGYLGGYSGNNTDNKAYTIGNTTTGGSANATGGSYGGMGGASSWSSSTINAIYGNMQLPGELGSGGGGNGGSPGGNGGGHLKLTTGTLSLNGNILADGGAAATNSSYSGAGSGGSILINVGTLAGTGIIGARGGITTNTTNSGGGGGGRIALYYDTNSLPTANIIATGGKSGDGSVANHNGSNGTTYLYQNVLPLTITKAGTGTGVIQSTPDGIACGATCGGNFPKSSNVILAAVPDIGSAFSGWSGACSGTGTCTLTMDTAKSVTAMFTIIPPPTVSISSPGGITKDNRPQLQYSVSAGTVVVKVDGIVVSKVTGDTLDLLADGPHTVRVEVNDSGATGFAESTVTVDTIAPTVTVTTLPVIVKTETYTLSGTVEAGATVTISANSSATIGTVTYGQTSSDWECVVTNLTPTPTLNTFNISATDAAGNRTTVPVNIEYKPGITPTLSSTSIAADYQGTLSITVIDLVAGNGDVQIEQLVDANRNGTADTGDSVIRSFVVADGTASTNANVPGDNDATVNGTVTTTLNYYLVSDLYHAPGEYLFRITQGADTKVIPFSVTAVNQQQTISGAITDGTVPVPGTMVRILDKYDHTIGYVVADDVGHYTAQIDVPGDYLLTPYAYGKTAATGTQQPVTVASSEQVVGIDLTLTTGAYHLTGSVKDQATGTGIAGVWVTATDVGATAVAITDQSGVYDLLLPAGSYTVGIANNPTMPAAFAKGYAISASQAATINLTADTTVSDILLAKCDQVITGVLSESLGNPLPGLVVQGKIPKTNDVNEPAVYAVSGANGFYALPLFAGDHWDIALHDLTAQQTGYLGTVIRNYSTTTGQPSGNNLTVYPITAWVQGAVKDSNNIVIPGVEVKLRNADSSITSTITTAMDGSYLLGATEGTWLVDALTENKGQNAVAEQSITSVLGQTVTADFIVDVAPSLVTTASPTGGTYTSGQTVTLSCSDGTGSGCDKIYYTTDGTTPTTASSVYSTALAISATTTLKYFATDLAGNSETVKSQTYTINGSGEPTGTVTINGGAASTKATAVTLTLTCTDNSGSCSQMQFSSDNVSWTTAETFTASKSWTLATGDGTKTVYVKFSDTDGNWSTAVNTSILLDTAAPTTSASPVGGSYSASQTVTLSCSDGSGSGCDKIYYTTDGSTPTIASSVYSGPLTIAATTTLKYFAFDLAGNKENVRYQTYTIDPIAPTDGTVNINSDASFSKSTSVTLTLTCTDNIACTKMLFSNDNVTWSNLYTYATTKTWYMSAGDGVKTVYAKFQDAAGNETAVVSDTILLDTAAPTTSASPAGGSYSASQTVSLSCFDSGSGCDKIYYTTDGSTPTVVSTVYSAPFTIAVTTTLKYFATDLAGNSETVKSQTYTIDGSSDATPPTGTVTISGGAVSTKTTAATLTLTCTDMGSGCSQMQFSNDNSSWSTVETYASSKTWTLATGDGTKTVYAKFQDNAGNWSTTVNDTIVLDTTVPTTSVAPAAGSYTESQTVTLSCSDGIGSGCDKIYYTTDGTTPTTASAIYSAPLVIATTTTLKYFATDLAGNSETVQSHTYTITIDTTPPTGTVVINGGATSTKTMVATLTLTCTDTGSGCFEMQFSNDSSTWSTAEATASSKAWTLTTGDGSKTVYVKFADSAGNWSTAVSDTILLDTTAPTTSVAPAGGSYTESQSVTLSCSDGTGSGCDKIYYTTDGTTPTPASSVYASALTISTTTTLKYFATDLAGNSETVKSQTYTIDIDTTPPSGTVTINGGAVSTKTTAATLTLTCTDPGSGCSQMQFSNDNSTWSTAETYATGKSWTLTNGDGTKTVYVKFSDSAGNWSTAVSDTILLDTTAPMTSASPAGGTYTASQTVTLSYSDGTGSGCDKIYYTTDGTTPTTTSSVYASALNISATTTLKYFATDFAGNSETVKSQTYTINGSGEPAGTVTINGGAASTKATAVTLTLTCTDNSGSCSQMQFSSDNVSWTTAETFTASKSWTLATGDGTKTVYVKFSDTDGNWSTAVNTSILLDTAAPTTSASPVGGSYSASQTVTLSCSDGSGSGCDKIYYTTDGSTPTIASSVYSGPLTIAATTALKYFAFDLAGNKENVRYQTYTIDSIAPTDETVIINSSASFSKSTSVTLALTCTDNIACTKMLFSNDNVTWSNLYTYATTKSWYMSAGDGTKTVYAKFQDAAGNETAVVSDTILLDTAAPTTSASPAGGSYTASQSVTLSCSDGGSGCDKIYYTTDGTTPTTASSVYSTALSIPTTSTLKYFATDLAGNSETVKSQTYTIQ